MNSKSVFNCFGGVFLKFRISLCITFSILLFPFSSIPFQFQAFNLKTEI